MKCCLCEKEILIVGTWRDGNNAMPLAKGRCCDKCNMEKVIPTILKIMES